MLFHTFLYDLCLLKMSLVIVVKAGLELLTQLPQLPKC
jgi:hypothetical protein